MVSLFRIIVLSCSLVTVSNGIADDADLVIEVLGARPGTGYVVLSLFSTPDNFMVQPVVEDTMKVNEAGTVTFVLSGLVEGRYAASVFYDENGNTQLDTGLFGIPKELVGFSNNARGLFGPPSFADAAFDLSVSTRLVIQLQRAKQ